MEVLVYNCGAHHVHANKENCRYFTVTKNTLSEGEVVTTGLGVKTKAARWEFKQHSEFASRPEMRGTYLSATNIKVIIREVVQRRKVRSEVIEVFIEKPEDFDSFRRAWERSSKDEKSGVEIRYISFSEG